MILKFGIQFSPIFASYLLCLESSNYKFQQRNKSPVKQEPDENVGLKNAIFFFFMLDGLNSKMEMRKDRISEREPDQ